MNKRPKSTSEYLNEAHLRNIFTMDLIESGWKNDMIEHRAILGYGGNICTVCGAPIIIFVNSQSAYTLPFDDNPWIVDKTYFRLTCPVCGYFNDVTELFEPAITPILSELRIKRITTKMSCQGHPKTTQQYSELVKPEDFKTIMENRWNGGGNHMWISLNQGKAIAQLIRERFPLPEGFKVCGKSHNGEILSDIAFIETSLENRDPVETRLALYNWAVSLPIFSNEDLGFIVKATE